MATTFDPGIRLKGCKDVRWSSCGHELISTYIDSSAANSNAIEDDWEGNVDGLKRYVGWIVEDCRERRDNKLISADSSTPSYLDLTQLSSSPKGINTYDQRR